MLHRGGVEGLRSQAADALVSSGPSQRVLLAVAQAPSPRLGNPTRWGWPHWLVPTSKAGGHRSTHRPLEDYG